MRIAVWFTVGAIALIMTLAYALPFGAQNQATYLLDPLHRAMPELFARDWLGGETPPYLRAFGWMFAWLFRIDPEGPTAVLTAHVVVMVATYVAVYWLITALERDL